MNGKGWRERERSEPYEAVAGRGTGETTERNSKLELGPIGKANWRLWENTQKSVQKNTNESTVLVAIIVHTKTSNLNNKRKKESPRVLLSGWREMATVVNELIILWTHCHVAACAIYYQFRVQQAASG